MKRNFGIFFIFFSVIIMLSACVGSGSGDWSYKLPNNYEIWKINSRNICIGYVSGSKSLSIYDENNKLIGIPGHVIEFANNNTFVVAKTVAIQEDLKVEINKENYKFYILNTENRTVVASIENENLFKAKCEEMHITNLTEWQQTSPPPKNAEYP